MKGYLSGVLLVGVLLATACGGLVYGQAGGTALALPNPVQRTIPDSLPYASLTPHQKAKLAFKGVVTPAILGETVAWASFDQWRNRDPSYGQGAQGFGLRVGANYGDKITSRMMREALFPTLLHQDPRYFRKGAGHGSFGGRMTYAVTRVLITRNDDGSNGFNYSGILGEATAVGISRAYHPDYQSAHNALQSLGTRLLFHAAKLVISEFMPDVRAKMSHKDRP